jgi:hypothetical protein
MQHFLEVYSQESENLKFVVGVDLLRGTLSGGSMRLIRISSTFMD